VSRTDAFLDDIANGPVRRMYAFFGEEDFFKDEAERLLFERIKRDMGGADPDRVVLHAREVSPVDAEAACSYSSLFGGLRFVVVDELELWNAADQKRFCAFLADPGPSPGAVLLIRTTVRKLPVTVAGVVSNVFWKPFDRDLLRFVERRLRAGGVGFDGDVPRLLVDSYAGEDVKSLRVLASELEKLALYMGRGGAVTTATVKQVCSAPPQAEWFRFIEAVAGRRLREALALARTFHETDPHGAVGFLSVLGARLAELSVLRAVADMQSRMWREIVSLCRRRSSPRCRSADRTTIDREIGALRKELADLVAGEFKGAVTGLPPWSFASRCLEVEGFSRHELAQAVTLAADAECRLKSGQGDPLTELDVLLTRLCVPGLLGA